MPTDPLDKETSVSGELTPSGVKAAARSRCVAALDRLLGNLLDYFNPALEGKADEQRAKIRARVAAIDAISEKAIDRLSRNSQYLDIFIENELLESSRKIENKAHVASFALNDLRDDPPTEGQNSSGPDEVDPNVMDRIKRYSEDASTDQVREKWGRVLASEIRKPGQLSLKSLRIIDEIDQSTALSFEEICRFRIGSTIPRFLFPKMGYMKQQSLINAELLMDPGITGHIRIMTKTNNNDGQEIWFAPFDNYRIAFDANDKWRLSAKNDIDWPITINEDKPSLPVYIITDAAIPIINIIKHNEETVLDLFTSKLASAMPEINVYGYRRNDSGLFLRISTKIKLKRDEGDGQ